MYTVKIENAKGEIIELTHNSNISVLSIEGLDPVNAQFNTSPTGTMPGEQLNSVRLSKRNIVINLAIEQNVENTRLMLYRYVSTGKSVKFYYKNTSRDVYINGYVESLSVERFDRKQLVQISIMCPRPWFRACKSETIEFSNTLPLFEFDFESQSEGVELSQFEAYVEYNVVNEGDGECGILIALHATGQVVNPAIYNKTTKEKILLKNTMQKGESIYINTIQGEKSVYLLQDGIQSNLIHHMDFSSNLFSLMPGDNIITCECDSGVENLNIVIRKSDNFGGV